MLQASGKQIPAEVHHLPCGQLGAQELHAGLIDLVRLVKHHHTHRGQQLGHARLAHRNIGKKQVVVDDHNVGRQRLAPGPVHMAGAELGALRTQAVLAGGGHQGNHGRAVIQSRQFRQVARLGVV